jgi:hypothetical protein
MQIRLHKEIEIPHNSVILSTCKLRLPCRTFLSRKGARRRQVEEIFVPGRRTSWGSISCAVLLYWLTVLG